MRARERFCARLRGNFQTLLLFVCSMWLCVSALCVSNSRGAGLRGGGLHTCRPVSPPFIISSASNSVLLMPWLLPQPSQVSEYHNGSDMQAFSTRVTSCAKSGQESSFLALYSKSVTQPSAGLSSKYENVADLLSSVLKARLPPAACCFSAAQGTPAVFVRDRVSNAANRSYDEVTKGMAGGTDSRTMACKGKPRL